MYKFKLINPSSVDSYAFIYPAKMLNPPPRGSI